MFLIKGKMKSVILRIKDGGNWWKLSLWYIWYHNTGVLVREVNDDVWWERRFSQLIYYRLICRKLF